MIRPFFVSLTLFGLLLSVRVWGYEFTHLTKDNNGLSYDGISAIMQDSRGFIWIGTYIFMNYFVRYWPSCVPFRSFHLYSWL